MKKIIVSVLAIAFTATMYAQVIPERKDDGYHPKSRNEKMKGGDNMMAMKQLNLSESQKEQLKAQRESMKQQMEALKKNDNISVKDWKAKREAIQKENKAKFESILTAEQKEKMKTMRADADKKRGNMQGGRRGNMQGGKSGMMSEKLNLSANQKAQIEKNRAEMMAQSKAIRENKSLTDAQKKEQMKSLHEKQRESFKTILTPEQQKIMKEQKSSQRGKGEKGKKLQNDKEVNSNTEKM